MQPQSISHKELHLDPLNLRLLERLKGESEKEVFKWCIAGASLIDIQDQIISSYIG